MLVAQSGDVLMIIAATQARGAAQMQAILQALPLAPWLTVDTTPLSPHPSDPAIIRPPATAPARTP